MPVDNTQSNDMGISQNTAQQGPIPTSTDPSVDTLNQAQPGQLSADDHAAALGYITTLSQHMFHGGGQEDPNQDPNAPQGEQGKPQEKPPEPKHDPKAEMEGFKKEMIDAIHKELGGIKDMVKQAITEEDAPKE